MIYYDNHYIIPLTLSLSQEYANVYGINFSKCEKYFRTGKQHGGLVHCQSINQDKQRFHVFSVMVAYAILQCMRIDKKKQSVEEILHPIRRQKTMADLFEYVDLEQTIMN